MGPVVMRIAMSIWQAYERVICRYGGAEVHSSKVTMQEKCSASKIPQCNIANMFEFRLDVISHSFYRPDAFCFRIHIP
jgi:hypothetical protein